MLNSTPEVGMPVAGYEDLYEISSHGRVSNFRKILKTYKINSGYVCIKLTKDGQRRSFLLHRLVAQQFIPNPLNLPEVNHLDGNKENNRMDNLQWSTSAQNKAHAKSTGLWKYNEPGKGVKRETTKSKYHNVRWDKSRQKWIGAVSQNNKPYRAKRFDSEVEAAMHVNDILDELGLYDRPRNQV